MKTVLLFYIASLIYHSSSNEDDPAPVQKFLNLGCVRNVNGDYRKAFHDFSTKVFKRVAKTEPHFVISPYSIWLAMSAMAEGSSDTKLLEALYLPKEKCLREKYYDIATSLESPGNDVTFSRKRLLVLNKECNLNTTWFSDVRSAGLIDMLDRKNTEVLQDLNLKSVNVKDLMASDTSVILDTLDYKGMWTTAFLEANIEKNASFFNDKGDEIGKVDLLRMRKRVKLAHLPLTNAKVLELPVGSNGRYRFLFVVNLGKNPIKRTIELIPNTMIIDMLEALRESLIPLEVAIPKFSITSEFDTHDLLQDIGADIWSDSNSTLYISTPPAVPSTIYHRTTVTIDSQGLEVPGEHSSAVNLSQLTGLASAIGREFVANRPFIFALVDASTRTCLFTGVYSNPTL